MSVGVTEPKRGARRAGLHLEAQLEVRQLGRDRRRVVCGLGLVPRPLRVPLLQLCDAGLRRLFGEPARQQEVARVAAR